MQYECSYQLILDIVCVVQLYFCVKILLQCWSETTLLSCCRYCVECMCFEYRLRRGMVVDEC